MNRCIGIGLAMSLAFVSSCGSETNTEPKDTADSSPTTTQDTEYFAAVTVLESDGSDPELCFGGVLESYPPQCGGPKVHGWDWDAVDNKESANQTTWGEFYVVGTWDGEALTLTETPREPTPNDARTSDPSDEISTPCDPPAGGWTVVDERTATDKAMSAAISHARAQPDVGGVWVDQSINEASDEEHIDEMAMNDPTKLILNLTFTGDIDRHETEVREIWGGSLCVSKAERSAAELETLRTEIHAELDDLLSSTVDERNSRVRVGVIIDDGVQQRLDDQFGDGLVKVHSSLQLVE